MEIIAFAINLEHIGDIIDKNLMELADKKIKHKLRVLEGRRGELDAFHKRMIDNLQARVQRLHDRRRHRSPAQLIEEKTQLRNAELAAAESHLARLREGRPESIETSSLHLDVLRDLKRIHSHICSVAYPVLEAAGELQPNRLKESIVRRLPTYCPRRRKPDSDGNELRGRPDHHSGRGSHMIRGSCLCGKVQYEINGPLFEALNCHCSMCRKARGAAFRSRARIKRSQARWVQGEDQITYYKSSPGNHRGFCRICSSPILSEFEADPTVFSLPLGAFDDDPSVVRSGMSMSKVKLHGLQSRTAFLNSMNYQNSDASMIRLLFYPNTFLSASWSPSSAEPR